MRTARQDINQDIKNKKTLTERKGDTRDGVSVPAAAAAAADDEEDDEGTSEAPWLYRRHSGSRWTRVRTRTNRCTI